MSGFTKKTPSSVVINTDTIDLMRYRREREQLLKDRAINDDIEDLKKQMAALKEQIALLKSNNN